MRDVELKDKTIILTFLVVEVLYYTYLLLRNIQLITIIYTEEGGNTGEVWKKVS